MLHTSMLQSKRFDLQALCTYTCYYRRVLTTDPSQKEACTAQQLWVSYDKLPQVVSVGSQILLDDGLIELTVQEISADSTAVKCLIVNPGSLKPRRGVNLPGAKVDLPALSDKDKRDIAYGIKNDIDFVAASFVRKAQDVRDIRAFIAAEHTRAGWSAEHPLPQIVSKIENTEAIENFGEILALSDAIMVARGDLGVEVAAEKVTNMQKWMVAECNRAGKPVIVATQMLESMQHNPRPTRAEVSCVCALYSYVYLLQQLIAHVRYYGM
jgi:pyruvate kinase